jgi:hypothetical protein
MHAAYVERVGQWMQTVPTSPWARDYAKHTSYSKEYVCVPLSTNFIAFLCGSDIGWGRVCNRPRERAKAKELGGPMLKTNLYSPRGVFKGGGECVRALVDGDPSAPSHERDQYKEAVRFIEKTRERDKEIQPPLSVPTNKSLECGHYFVEDVVCARPPSRQTLQSIVDHHHFDPPPTTAEYVAHPQWRVHSPERWVGPHAFVPTVQSTNVHTAQNRSITGAHYAPSVLTDEVYVAQHKRHPLAPKDAQLNPRDHERRAQTAVAMLREAKSPQRHDRKYFGSMWTQPGSPSRAAEIPVDTEPITSQTITSNSNAGRTLTLQLRERASQGIHSPRRSRAKTQRRTPHGVLVRPLAAAPTSATN